VRRQLGDHAAAHHRDGHPGVACHHPKIAQQRQGHARADGVAVDRRDDRLA
jgi:hypothetical protein